jgi:ABC-type nitrate/sulfonate/bicarbonate transport system permease component
MAAVRGIAGLAAFLLLWEIAPEIGLVDGQFLPSPGAVFHELIRQVTELSFWRAIGQTMRAWALGIAISGFLGIALGVAIGVSPFLRRATHSTIEFLRPVPSVALVPVAVVVYGISLKAELLLIVYACFWIILIQVLYGIADLDSVAVDNAKVLRLTWRQRIRYLVWPTTLPFLFTGLRLSATVALILAISAELLIGTPGLGNAVALAQSTGHVSRMYALVVVTGLIGILMNVLMRTAERRILAWHVSVRMDQTQ